MNNKTATVSRTVNRAIVNKMGINRTSTGFSNVYPAAGSGMSITCFDNEIPSFIEPAMNSLYGSLFSSMARFRVYGGAENASTYVARRNQDIVAIFLFRLEDRRVRVLNEGMSIDDAAVNCFADYVFGRFKTVNLISFNAVESTINRLRYPYQQFNCTEDSVVTLPNTPEGYLNLLGKSTRRNLKQYTNRLKRHYPSFNYCVYEGAQVDEKFVRSIIRFNRMRFANKNKMSAITDAEEERILRMVRDCGMVGVATIDGVICAGSITYCVGDHYYSWLKAHDPAYDDYRFGVIISFLMISECIARGGKTFHFMWGRQPQKAQLHGEHRDRAHVTIYRSGIATLRHANVMLDSVYRDRVRQTRLWLLEMEKRDGTWPRTVRATLGGLRKAKALISGSDRLD